ncbi:hypothetical protein CCACVL1_25829 [Corchorus capsularis]|uniref:Uncharacterized protein n=1 Tax=Corchorus capsularis TaxID=210143 RepID=A0A1R3GH36_COCAP|nr:hypothetical protein CCACVL1_25829 [Corchorus capsularis]
MIEIKKQYATFDEKVIGIVPLTSC